MIFSYPVANAHTTLSFRHRMKPQTTSRTYLQDSSTTVAGVTITQDYRAIRPTLSCEFPNMPLTDKIALDKFFLLVGGMARSFKLTLVDGSTKTVRFADPVIEYTHRTYEVWSASFSLLEVI